MIFIFESWVSIARMNCRMVVFPSIVCCWSVRRKALGAGEFARSVTSRWIYVRPKRSWARPLTRYNVLRLNLLLGESRHYLFFYTANGRVSRTYSAPPMAMIRPRSVDHQIMSASHLLALNEPARRSGISRPGNSRERSGGGSGIATANPERHGRTCGGRRYAGRARRSLGASERDGGETLSGCIGLL